MEICDQVQDAIGQVVVDKVAEKYQIAKMAEITEDIPALVTVAAQDYKLNQEKRDGALEHLYRDGIILFIGSPAPLHE